MVRSVNPFKQEEIASFDVMSAEAVDTCLEAAHTAFVSWREVDVGRRCAQLERLPEVLRERREELAKIITAEMGKPITESLAEIDKCAWLCRYYAAQGVIQLQPETFRTDAASSYVRFDPLGIILGVMPWNYPFWQVFRFAVPTLAAGNTVLLKHASNVWLCAECIESVFKEAGFPDGVFQNLRIEKDAVGRVLDHPAVRAVSLTGSKPAGASVASFAANRIKKSVLELGGSNALVVFADADLDRTLDICIRARFQNTGQSCIAGKRLLIDQSIASEFLERLCQRVRKLKSGDPMDPQTDIGVMAREDLAAELESQMNASLEKGARLLEGGNRLGTFFQPTVLADVEPGMPVFEEETFGPLLAVTTFNSEEEALSLVSRSEFGLGVSLFTKDLDRARRLIPLLDEGAVFVNELVKSDPRLPFGGVKISGFGRELSSFGIREFVNAKTVYIAS
jgi:succinate-semialdehyde dehydrogenase/glutarate-semialdehyde dehydrogenase